MSKLKLYEDYRGRLTKHQIMPSGIYDLSDVSQELVDLLISKKRAEVIHEPAETIPQEAKTESAPIEDAPQPTRRRRSTKRKASS